MSIAGKRLADLAQAAHNTVVTEKLEMRIHGDASLPTLIYLPGLHGDWTLVGGFRRALGGRVRFVEVTYPRTLIWTLEDCRGCTSRLTSRDKPSLARHGFRRLRVAKAEPLSGSPVAQQAELGSSKSVNSGNRHLHALKVGDHQLVLIDALD